MRAWPNGASNATRKDDRMNRHHWHGLFAVTVAALILAIVFNAYKLKQLTTLKHQVNTLATQESGSAALQKAAEQSEHPAIGLVAASKLVQTKEFQPAESLLVALMQEHEGADVGIAATYNLANSYMHQAAIGQDAGARTAALVELAKERYREALRLAPNDWATRFNLERALRLAPETDESTVENRNDPIKRVNVVVPDFTLKDLP